MKLTNGVLILDPGEEVNVQGQKLATTTYRAKDHVRVKDGRPVPVVTPPPPPPGDLPGWALVFSDDFTTWDSSRYFVYPTSWLDTSKNGYRNSPGGITSDGTKLRARLFSQNGMAYGCHFVPLAGPNGTQDLLSMRVEFRLRADRMPGFKGVPLLWPKSDVWPRDGEIDGPEGDFNGSVPMAFMHRQGGTSGSDQDAFTYPSATRFDDWHTYASEWRAGVSCEYFVDGASIGKATNRVPSTPMHLVMQFETNLEGYKPDPAVSGYVEIDYLKVWVPSA